MAEAFGIVSGAAGIAAAFTSCVDCFQYVQVGRHFGRDFQTDLLSLNFARLRLTRWGQAVNVLGDPQLGRPDATPDELRAVKNSLLQILILFTGTEKISKKYKLNAKAGDDLSILSAGDLEPAIVSLENKMKALAMKRQKRTSISKTASWALYHRSELRELITNITSLIDQMENLFPAPQKQIALVREEIAEIQDSHALKYVEKAAEGVDDMLYQAAKEARTGHQYLNVKITNKAKGQTADTYSSDWNGKAVGTSHSYNGVLVNDATALIGNTYGGKDFWEE
jgi:uncharacterized small protein (DUF1192 family)